MVDDKAKYNEMILEKIEPVIEYALLQTQQQNRNDLRQYLLEVVLKTLHTKEFSKPKGIFIQEDAAS